MMRVNRALMDHPALTSAGGAVMGYAAASGNPWAILGCLASVGAYLQARKLAKAQEAARAAAIETAKHDPACVGDLHSPACIAAAKTAAIAAGQAVMQPPAVWRPSLGQSFLIAACLTFAIVWCALR